MRTFPNHMAICISLVTVLFVSNSYSQKLTKQVRVTSGAVNGVFIEKNGKTLVVYGDPKEEINKAEMVLFTHFRRDVIWAGRNLVQKGALAVVPTAQKSYFTKGDSIWSNFRTKRFHDYSNQTTKVGIAPVKVHRFVQGGEIVKWQDIDFTVLNTPGYTRGSVTYLADIDNKRFAFTGDLIYGDGKIIDLYSFQDSLRGVDGYHGYATRLGQLVSSLQRIAEQKPDYLIPSRGPIIMDPAPAIQKLMDRIHSLYQNYLSITAQRWNHTDRMITLTNHVLGPAAGVDWMPFASVIEKNPPSWYKHINSSNLVVAQDSSAFLIDCGSRKVIDELVKLRQSGRIKRVEGIFITHYHDDHTDFINEAVKEFGCPVYVTSELKDVLEHPAAFHMACLTTELIPTMTTMQDGQKMSWKEFALTFRYFPGQTIYHDALLVQKTNGEAIFFIGDSFSPAGIDDYCFQNRNWLQPGTGYFRCLDILKGLPDHVLLSNQHIQPLFEFSRQQLDRMTSVLDERNAILKGLFPWDDVNYGTDDQWAGLYPYGQKGVRGKTVDFAVKIFNHSDTPKTFFVEAVVPDGFSVKSAIKPLVIEPRTEGGRTFTIKIPKEAPVGVSLVVVNVKFDAWDLREWSEGMIEIE